MIGTPRVSVVMSAYNPGAKLHASVESVLSQTFSDFEFIILDDASADGTAARLGDFARADARVRVLTVPVNRGLTQNLIRGVEAARGEYIARIDAGDTWVPAKLALQVAFMDARPGAVLCGTQVVQVSGGKAAGQSTFATTDAELRKRLFTREGLLSHPTILFRNMLNYRGAFRFSQDLDLYARLAFLGTMHCLPEPLVHCEVGDDGITVNSKFLQRQYQGHAYRLFEQRFRTGTDDLDRHPERGLTVRGAAWEKRLCGFSVLFFRLFMRHKIQGRPRPLWLTWFALSLALYPPFIKDYATRFLRMRRHRISPWMARPVPIPPEGS